MGTHTALSPQQVQNWRVALSLEMGPLAYALPEEAIIELRDRMQNHFNQPSVSAPVEPPAAPAHKSTRSSSWPPKLGDLIKKG